MNKNKLTQILLIFLIILFAIGSVKKTFENDTFFTIACGNEVLSNGMQEIDQLVWHDNLEYTNSRWLFDIIIAFLCNKFDFFGIYVFVIIIAICQVLLFYYILNKISKRKYFAFLFTIIISLFIQYEWVARAQVISFLLFLLEFYSIEKISEEKCAKRYIIYLIIIPILLANFHASVFPMYFVMYLPYIAQFILSILKLKSKEDSKIIIENCNIKRILILFIIGFICGFIKPEYVHPFSDIFKVTDGISSLFISELQPLELLNCLFFVFIIGIFISIITFTKTKIKLTDFLYILGFAILSLYAYRCAFYFCLISTICIYRLINSFFDEYNINFKLKLNNKYMLILSILVIILFVIYSISLIVSKLNDDYVYAKKYPVDASNYILENLDIDNMKIFNGGGLGAGSYLEYRGIPVFIDSRTGMYTEEFNEGCTILEDWYNLTSGSVSYKEIFDKYEITHALLYNYELINLYICDDSEWKEIYQDDIYTLYERVEE